MKRLLVCVLAVLGFGCEEPSAELPESRPPLPDPQPEGDLEATVVHEVQAYPLEGGQETQLCYSWTLDNDAPLYVQGTTFQNGGSFHHSNWFVVPEDLYPGDDGYWPCDSRGFEDVPAALSGTVLFAQSTQAQRETVAFRDGVVIKVPARSKIVAGVHLLNLGPDPRETAGWMSLDVVHPALVSTVLSPIMFSYFDLDIGPQARVRFTGTCAIPPLVSMRVHYLLPHYHGAGVAASVSAPQFDGEALETLTLLDHRGFSATAAGKVLDPPAELYGGSLTFSCEYDNPYPQPLGWGIGLDEMCVFLGLAEGSHIVAGGVPDGASAVVGVEDGVVLQEGECQLGASPRGLAYALPERDELGGPLVLPPFADAPPPDIPSCEDVVGTFDEDNAPTFADVQARVLQPWCSFSSCHGAAAVGDLDLRGEEAYDALVDVPSFADPQELRVAPGAPDDSRLYRLMSQCQPEGARAMPPGAPTLIDADAIGLVRAWIEAGAPA